MAKRETARSEKAYSTATPPSPPKRVPKPKGQRTPTRSTATSSVSTPPSLNPKQNHGPEEERERESVKGSGKKGDVRNKGADHTSKGETKSKEVTVEPKWREEFMVLDEDEEDEDVELIEESSNKRKAKGKASGLSLLRSFELINICL